jgi:AcrR family transcriptional regulator
MTAGSLMGKPSRKQPRPELVAARRAPPARPRRTPQQSRSRERVDAMIEAARRLIGTRGNDAVSVREIASEARVPVSSVYQYFPDKNAILRRLMEGYLETIQMRLVNVFGRVERPEQLPDAADEAIDTFHRLFVDEPALATIWAGVQANTVLRELDAEDTQLNADFVASVLRRMLPDVDAEEIADVSLFAIHMAGATVRLALISDEDGARRLMRELKRLARVRLTGLIARQVSVGGP